MSFLEYLVNQEKSKRITKKDALDMKMNYLTLNHKDKKELDSQYSNEKKPVIPKGEKIISKNNNEKKPVIPKGEKIISKNNWMGAYGVETGPDVSENWYLTYNGPAPPVSEVHGKNYGVNIGNGVIPIRFYDEKWGVPKQSNEPLIVEDLSQNESPIEVNTINEELLVNFMKSIRPSNYELIFDTYYVFLKNKFSPNKEVDDKIKLAAKKQLRGGDAEIFYKEYINRKVKENSNYDNQIDSEIKQKVLHPKKKRIKKNTAGEKIIEVDYDKFKQITTSRTPTRIAGGRLFFGVMVWGIENYSLQLGLRHIKGPKIESILIDYDLLGADWVFLRNGQISFVIDNENFDFPANETKTDVGSYGMDRISEFGYYEISQIFLKKLCDSKSLAMRVSGESLIDIGDNEANLFRNLCQQFYNNVFDDTLYVESFSINSNESTISFWSISIILGLIGFYFVPGLWIKNDFDWGVTIFWFLYSIIFLSLLATDPEERWWNKYI